MNRIAEPVAMIILKFFYEEHGMLHGYKTIVITLVASGVLSAAEPQSPTKEIPSNINKPQEEPEKVTGIYAILSPEVGGGQLVSGDRLGEVVYVSESPVLTALDIEEVRVCPEDDRFAIKLKITKTASERLVSAARLGESDHARLLASVQSLVIVRNGKAKPNLICIEDLASEPVLDVTTYSSLVDAKAFFDLFEPTRESK